MLSYDSSSNLSWNLIEQAHVTHFVNVQTYIVLGFVLFVIYYIRFSGNFYYSSATVIMLIRSLWNCSSVSEPYSSALLTSLFIAILFILVDSFALVFGSIFFLLLNNFSQYFIIVLIWLILGIVKFLAEVYVVTFFFFLFLCNSIRWVEHILLHTEW